MSMIILLHPVITFLRSDDATCCKPACCEGNNWACCGLSGQTATNAVTVTIASLIAVAYYYDQPVTVSIVAAIAVIVVLQIIVKAKLIVHKA